MDQKAALLAEINAEIPAGVDWRAGARRYLSAVFQKANRESIECYSLIKPFGTLGKENEAGRAEVVAYFNNFINLVHRIRPSAGMRVLDVACGGGWLSHYMAKLGSQTFGIDISQEFIELARRRFREDRHLGIASDQIDRRFAVHDIEVHPLPAECHGTFDLVVLESCLHHFVNPIAAMSHIAEALNDDGVVVIIEGENRKGPIKEEWMSVMREFDTLERPYSRRQLEAILDVVGLPEMEFLGQLNGWFSLDDEVAQNASWYIRHAAESMNLCICAKRAEAMTRIFPRRVRATILRFGRGWCPRQNGFRWCGPMGEIEVVRPVNDACITLHGHGKPQTVVVFGPDGERGRAEFTEHRQGATVALGDLKLGDILTFCSSEAFRPSWSGSDDTRLLSFYAEVVE